MNYEPLMQIVVDALWFFELSPAEAVDDDAAVEMIEPHRDGNLQALDTAEKENFLAYAARCGGGGQERRGTSVPAEHAAGAGPRDRDALAAVRRGPSAVAAAGYPRNGGRSPPGSAPWRDAAANFRPRPVQFQLAGCPPAELRGMSDGVRENPLAALIERAVAASKERRRARRRRAPRSSARSSRRAGVVRARAASLRIGGRAARHAPSSPRPSMTPTRRRVLPTPRVVDCAVRGVFVSS